jgi:hypothetical protein
MIRKILPLLVCLGSLTAETGIPPALLKDLIDLPKSISQKMSQGTNISPNLLPDLVSPQLEKALQDMVDKRKENSSKPTSSSTPEKSENDQAPKENDLLAHSQTLEELESHVLQLQELKPAQKATLLSLIQTLDERPDDAFITLKGLKQPEKLQPWLQLQELYLNETLGMEEETRSLGEELRVRWFPERLRVPKIEFCRSVKTFGNFEPMGDVLESGKHTLIYIELTGLTQEVQPNGFRRNYQVGFDVFSEGEKGSDLSQPPQAFEDFSRSRRGETYVWIKWKAMLTPGPYKMIVTVKDTISGQSLDLDKSFTIK